MTKQATNQIKLKCCLVYDEKDMQKLKIIMTLMVLISKMFDKNADFSQFITFSYHIHHIKHSCTNYCPPKNVYHGDTSMIHTKMPKNVILVHSW